jgi:hypothetical protein
MSNAAIESLIFIGEFFYALTHNHPWAAVIMRISLVIAGRGRWLLRIFIAILIATLHDAWTGQLWSDIQ